VFGEHTLDTTSTCVLLLLSLSLLAAYVFHANHAAHPLLRLDLLKVRTFCVSLGGGFLTRLGFGGLPFLLPLLFQLGLGLPAWQSGLLMMPPAASAMLMKVIAPRLLQRFGYRQILVMNTAMIGITIGLFALVDAATPLFLIVLLGLTQGFFSSLQFTAMNSMAYADIDNRDTSMASTIASSLQQLSLSFGLACGSLIAGWFIGHLPQTEHVAITRALHAAFLTLGGVTLLSSLVFWTLRPEDGQSVSGNKLAVTQE